jgi:hypothetical protein
MPLDLGDPVDLWGSYGSGIWESVQRVLYFDLSRRLWGSLATTLRYSLGELLLTGTLEAARGYRSKEGGLWP